MLKGLPAGRGPEALGGWLTLASALIVDGANPIEHDRPENFFDLIICCGPSALKICSVPDVYIHIGNDISTNNVVWLPQALESLEKSLVVVNKAVSKELAAVGVRPRNFMVEVGHDKDMVAEIVSKFSIPESQTWTIETDRLMAGDSRIISKTEFFGSKDRFGVPINQRSSGRKLLMERR